MFNPHNNTTADGVLIVKGLVVRDYDFEVGTVVADDTSPLMCENEWCDKQHWFEVERMSGGRVRKSFDGSRMVATF